MIEAPPERKPVFYKRSALPAGSATYRMLPFAVMKEILYVIKPETYPGEDNTSFDQASIKHAILNSVKRETLKPKPKTRNPKPITLNPQP
jgi:hypothetical protein